MRRESKIAFKEINFFVITAMIFAVCEVLSIQLNNYFKVLNIFGYEFNFNVSVIFFCFSFFIIDLVTEIYDNKVANLYINSKLISQILYILFGNLGVNGAGIPNGQIAESFAFAPYILFNSMIASFVAYKITGAIMQYQKVRYNGKFLFARYLSSTFPGEVIFSLIFSFLTFSHGRSFTQMISIFRDLVLVKLVISIIFSFFIVFITNLVRHYLQARYEQNSIDIVEFN